MNHGSARQGAGRSADPGCSPDPRTSSDPGNPPALGASPLHRLPQDRGHVSTEGRHPRSENLDELAAAEIAALLAEDQRSGVEAVIAASADIGALVEELVPKVQAGGRLVYLGAGTSGRLGVLDASECPPTFQSDPTVVVGVIAGGDGALRRSSEGAEDDPLGAEPELARLQIGALDTVVGIAAGGTTPWVLGALAVAKRRGSSTVLITCAPRSLPADCDRLIVLETGPEILTGSTRLKAGTATKVALNAITTALFVRLGKCHGNLMVDLKASNEKLLDRAIRLIQALHPQLDRAAAAAAIAEAGGSVKVAAVMLAHGLPRHRAEARLAEAVGLLRDALR